MKVGYLGLFTEPNYRGWIGNNPYGTVLNHLEENGVDLLLVSGGRGFTASGFLKEGR